METIGKQEVGSFYNDSDKSESVRDIRIVRSGPGHRVTSFLDLAMKVGELAGRQGLEHR
jgi:hypothetical protein